MEEIFALQSGITVESYPYNNLTGILIIGSDSNGNPFELYLDKEKIEILILQMSEEYKSNTSNVVALSRGVTSNKERSFLHLSGFDSKNRVFQLFLDNDKLQSLLEFILK